MSSGRSGSAACEGTPSGLSTASNASSSHTIHAGSKSRNTRARSTEASLGRDVADGGRADARVLLLLMIGLETGLGQVDDAGATLEAIEAALVHDQRHDLFGALAGANEGETDRQAVASGRIDEANAARRCVEDRHLLGRVVETGEERRKVVAKHVLDATHTVARERGLRHDHALVHVTNDRAREARAAFGVERIGRALGLLLERLARADDHVARRKAPHRRAIPRDALCVITTDVT